MDAYGSLIHNCVFGVSSAFNALQQRSACICKSVWCRSGRRKALSSEALHSIAGLLYTGGQGISSINFISLIWWWSIAEVAVVNIIPSSPYHPFITTRTVKNIKIRNVSFPSDSGCWYAGVSPDILGYSTHVMQKETSYFTSTSFSIYLGLLDKISSNSSSQS